MSASILHGVAAKEAYHRNGAHRRQYQRNGVSAASSASSSCISEIKAAAALWQRHQSASISSVANGSVSASVAMISSAGMSAAYQLAASSASRSRHGGSNAAAKAYQRRLWHRNISRSMAYRSSWHQWPASAAYGSGGLSVSWQHLARNGGILSEASFSISIAQQCGIGISEK